MTKISDPVRGTLSLPAGGRGPYLPFMTAESAVLTPASIRELVGRFYARAREDAELGPVFEAGVEDWDHHLDHIALFWSSALLGVGRFAGSPMIAHRRHPITPQMFDRWLALWRQTTDEMFPGEIAQALQARAARIGESLKLGLFYNPADDQRATKNA
jgi:hemoglobin